MLNIRKILSAQKNQVNRFFLRQRYKLLAVRHRKILKKLKAKLGTEPIKVGFLGYLDGPSCDVFTELYYMFDKDKRFNCTVVTVPYTHDEKGKMIKKQRLAINYLKIKV